MIGLSGAGKSTLVNNILGEDVAQVGHLIHSQTVHLNVYSGEVQGVPVDVYDTPGLGDTRLGHFDDQILHKISQVLAKVDVIIFCFGMSTSRVSFSVFEGLRRYNDIGINWEKTVVALTFADVVPIPPDIKRGPKSVHQKFFNDRVEEWKSHIKESLGHNSVVAILPTTDDREATLWNGEPWFNPFWLAIVRALPVTQMAQFLRMNRNEPPPTKRPKRDLRRTTLAKTKNPQHLEGPFQVALNEEEAKELQKIIEEKSSKSDFLQDLLSIAAIVGGGVSAFMSGGVEPFIMMIVGGLGVASLASRGRKRKRLS